MKNAGLRKLSCTFFCVMLLLLSACVVKYKPYQDSTIESFPKTIPKEAPIESKYIVASWYGSDFHGKPTASGEPYNMYAKTCAHKEYAFGTKLKVTNINNGKAVECTVNDRGPFVAGRDLDLSYTCAKEIDIIGTGTGKVRIDYIDRDTRYVKYVKYIPSSGKGGPYTIQIGSFKELSNATRLKAALEFKYTNVYVTSADINDAKYYRVRIGKFNQKEEAQNLAKTLADEGYGVLITHYEEKI